ncbi:MAG: recombinase RecT [Methylobacter sp.]
MNAIVQKRDKPKFSVAIQTDAYKKLIENTLGDTKRSQRFIASVSSAVAANPALQDCEPGSILSSALLGEGLNLSPSPQLGQYYMVPYKRKANQNKGITEAMLAQFQLGYKGYIQLAIRSGFYLKINVLDIKKGELVRFNPLSEEITVNLIEDELERESAETTGYYAMFEYLNGFRKEMYWSKEKMLSHADKYSAAFKKSDYNKIQKGEMPSSDMWKYSSFWYKDFDAMAFKTMLRQLISKWGVMSTEMTEAFTKDNAVIKANGDFDYIDSTTADVSDNENPVINEPDVLPECTGETFEKNQKAWFALVESGKKTSADLIAWLSAKYTLTEDQQKQINDWELIHE